MYYGIIQPDSNLLANLKTEHLKTLKVQAGKRYSRSAARVAEQ